jgi:hypothetical protein
VFFTLTQTDELSKRKTQAMNKMKEARIAVSRG